MKRTVKVTCEEVSDFSELHPIDQKEGPDAETYIYEVYAESAEAARDLALDKFHESVPIKCLDDYSIGAEVISIEIRSKSREGVERHLERLRVSAGVLMILFSEELSLDDLEDIRETIRNLTRLTDEVDAAIARAGEI